jgi:hypothetical protein
MLAAGAAATAAMALREVPAAGTAIAHEAAARPELPRRWNRIEGATGALNVTACFGLHPQLLKSTWRSRADDPLSTALIDNWPRMCVRTVGLVDVSCLRRFDSSRHMPELSLLLGGIPIRLGFTILSGRAGCSTFSLLDWDEHRADASVPLSLSNAVAVRPVSVDPSGGGEGTTEQVI